MTPDIISKLSQELNRGITSEIQVVYLLAGIRKIMERNEEQDQYNHLNFHCNWVLHSRLTGPEAQNVLRIFENVHLELRTGSRSADLPPKLQKSLQEISKMDAFKEELDRFLKANGMPRLDAHRPDGWTHFLHLYAQVIKDIPLEIPQPATSYLSKVVIDVEFANKVVNNELYFRIIWNVDDREGHSGCHEVYNSFSLDNDNSAGNE